MGENATQGGSSASLRHPDLWYYDQLPPTARQALANAKFDWSAGYFYNRWQRGVFKTGAAVAAAVKRADAGVKQKPVGK
jgi:Family of unknown function (DUF6525)